MNLPRWVAQPNAQLFVVDVLYHLFCKQKRKTCDWFFKFQMSLFHINCDVLFPIYFQCSSYFSFSEQSDTSKMLYVILSVFFWNFSSPVFIFMFNLPYIYQMRIKTLLNIERKPKIWQSSIFATLNTIENSWYDCRCRSCAGACTLLGPLIHVYRESVHQSLYSLASLKVWRQNHKIRSIILVQNFPGFTHTHTWSNVQLLHNEQFVKLFVLYYYLWIMLII